MRQSMKSERAASGKAMNRISSFSFSIFALPLHFLLFLTHLFLLSSSHPTTFPDVNTQNPQIELLLSQHVGSFCERICVSGTSRLNLKSYASTLSVTLKASEHMELRLQENIEICLHRNTSLETCQCGNDDWRSLQKGDWKFAMSPYDTKFVDIKFKERISGSITVYVEEEFQQWRLFCLGIGFLMLLMAPIVSKWVPFYYSSSMALGVFLVILLILFQGMKLLPMGRKSFLYLTLYGSVLGIGSYIAHYFSTLVNSILVSFGMSDEMHNPVSIFLLVGIVLAGAALGYWIVRKFVLTEDGQIDAGIAQFVKWSMRFIAVVFLLQSSHDTLLALAALGTSWSFCSFVASIKRPNSSALINKARNPGLWQQRAWQASSLRSSRNAEFLNPSGNNKAPRQPLWRACPPSYLHNLSNSPLKGAGDRRCIDEDFYSSFHKAPARKFSKTEWEDFTRESTRVALSDWASTPEVARWIADNACRMRLIRDSTSDDSVGSSSGSSEETAVDEGSCLSIFKWPFSS